MPKLPNQQTDRTRAVLALRIHEPTCPPTGAWRFGANFVSHRTLLLFPHLGVELAIIGRALRDAGHLVFPARFHEDSVDALVRVRPTLVLIEATHCGAVVTPQFRALAGETGATVVVYSRTSGDGDAATMHSPDAGMYPVIDFSGQGRALVGLLAEVQGGHAA